MSSFSSSLNANCAIIIVTHNSQRYLKTCLSCLKAQTKQAAQIIVIDSGSNPEEIEFLKKEQPSVYFYFSKVNVGFCKGNNIGLSLVKKEIKYILFLNPDAFLSSNFLEKAEAFLEKKEEEKTAVVSGILLEYDIVNDRPTGRIDSSGIFRKWYGNWYDRAQGQKYHKPLFTKVESVPALCGALMFCRKEALDSILLKPNEVWDNSFFMYKDDIDLSLRLKKKKWQLKFFPDLIAYHCRGWHKERAQIPKHLKLLSAKNEVKLCTRHLSPCLLYSSLKYLSVKLFNI